MQGAQLNAKWVVCAAFVAFDPECEYCFKQSDDWIL
jgi:hypothetical protein